MAHIKRDYKRPTSKKDAKLFIVIDRDKQSWTNEMISNIATVCYQKKNINLIFNSL